MMKEGLKIAAGLEPVAPVKPIAPYLGGKRNLSARLVERIAAVPHDLYAEPFVGMGGVFFRRQARPKKELINDINAEVVNVFRLLQRHYQQLLDTMKWQLCSRAEFDRLNRSDPRLLTDLERAARFIYLQRTSFGGKVVKQSYGVTRTNPARFDLTKLVPMLEDVHERLCGVDIECLPYARFIALYDSPGALFYLDPPYWDCEDDYGGGVFSKADFEALSSLLEGLQGRFILSINDRPEIRAIFGWAAIEAADVNYRISGTVTPAKELIISGPG